jgi:serine/threonine-protein kinase RsbW
MPYYRCPACGVTGYSAAAYSTARTCSSCSSALPDGSRLDGAPGAKYDVTRVLRARPEAAAEARGAVSALPLSETSRETVALIVSELATNSIRHAQLSPDDAIELHLGNGDGEVRVAVHDGGGGFSPPTAPADPLAIGGRGLAIVAALSTAWGVVCDGDGCTVWCEVAVDDGPTADAGRVRSNGGGRRFVRRPARALTQEVLAMTPGTSQFVRRVRAITVYLDAEKARAERRIESRPDPPARLT